MTNREIGLGVSYENISALEASDHICYSDTDFPIPSRNLNWRWAWQLLFRKGAVPVYYAFNHWVSFNYWTVHPTRHSPVSDLWNRTWPRWKT